MKRLAVSRAEYNFAEHKNNKHHEHKELCDAAKYWEQPARAKYMSTYGCHFNAKTAEFAISKLKNRDKSSHYWSCSEVEAALKPLGVTLTDVNKWDAYYLANMYYSDFFDKVVFTEPLILKMAVYKLTDLDGDPTDIYGEWEEKMMRRCEYLVYANFVS